MSRSLLSTRIAVCESTLLVYVYTYKVAHPSPPTAALDDLHTVETTGGGAQDTACDPVVVECEVPAYETHVGNTQTTCLSAPHER